ncbi:MAG: hypothetical protein HY754_13025 [Nitrospirae bacterium]|nr:hypothetical protein [Nitrospirota bacterium]
MSKYYKFIVLALLLVGLMAGSAFAGSITANNGTPATIALEAMGTARNVTLSGAGNNAISFTSSRSLISGDLLAFTMTNVGTDGNPISLCETGNDVTMDATNTSANSTNFSVRANRSVTSGTKMYLTSISGSGSCNNASSTGLAVRFQPLSSAGMATVSFNITSYGSAIDSANAVNIGNIARQFVTNYVSGNSTIDFAANTTSNGVRFLLGSNTSVPGNAEIRFTDMTLNAAGLTGSGHAGLAVSAILGLQDSASWQGVQRVYVNSSLGCALASNVVANNSPSGTVNLTIPATAFNGAATFIGNVCADVTGNVALQSRTIKGSYDISVGSGGTDPTADSYATVMTWTPNGYQGIIPYLNGSATYKTICIINNKSTATASATLDIISTESGATLSSLSGLSLGTIAAQGTMRVDFDSSITPYSYSSGTETAGTATTLTGLQSNDRYSAMINVGASPTQITVNCIQLDPAGSKRAVPVLTQVSASNPWQQ